MSAKRYSLQEREAILKRVNEIGIKKTCEEFGVNAQSVYKWKRASVEQDIAKTPEVERERVDIDVEELKNLMSPNTELELKIKALEEENAVLHERNEKMRKMLMALANALYDNEI